MKILIVSSGLKPHHFGGLPSHVEDVLRGFVARGIEVAYLNTGARTGRTGTHLSERTNVPWRAWDLESRWAHTGYWCGTVDPAEQIVPDAAYSRAIREVAQTFAPDIVHFHELTSFPLAAAAVFRDAGARTVFSAHDFFALCPTAKLQRPDGSVCDRFDSELDCELCSRNARSNRHLQIESAWDRRLSFSIPLRNLVRRAIRSRERIARSRLPRDAYKARRREFVRHLEGFDAVLMTSTDQLRRFNKYCGAGVRLHLLPLSRTTFSPAQLPARTDTVHQGRIVFLALNIVNSAKGLALIERTFAALASSIPEVELHLYGPTGPNSPGIRRLGIYSDAQLDEIVASADFGIIPSIWPEAYGYVGPEMLSRGLPVIASGIGAMPDYVTDGGNGLLFDPTKPAALEAVIRRLVADPGLRRRLWQQAATGARSFLTMDEHLDRLTDLYAQIVNGHSDNVVANR